MKATQCKILFLLVVCFAAPLFSDNQPSSFQAPFVGKIEEPGPVIHATPASTFAKRIKTAGSLVDTIQTADNSYVSVIQINSKNFLVRKIASSGSRVWERILRLQVDDPVSLAAITQTTDGGYILAGSSVGCFGFYCYYYGFDSAGILIKLRSNGTVAWKREYTTNSNDAVFTSLVSTANGGVIVTGTTQNSLILARYTSTGSILWSKSFPDLRVNDSPQLVETPNNSLILVANAGALVIKVNDSGAILWKKSLQMPNLLVQTITATSDNGIVLAGSCNNCKQVFVVRLKADGNVKSKLRYSLQVSRVGSVTDIIQTSDGGFTITGSVTDKAGNNPSVFVAKIDSKGKASFQRTLRIAQSRGVSVFALSDGYLLFGLANVQDTIILKLDSQSLLPGCDFVSSAAISRIPFGNLTISQGQINVAADLSLGTSDLVGSSIAARRPESDLCP